MSRLLETDQPTGPKEQSPVPPGMRFNDADVRRRLLGDFLASGNPSLLLAWAQLELAQQAAELVQEEQVDEGISF